jgi:5-methyltetrahydropteroyltriglutamate--homocysteine methyltransferase
MLTHNLGYPRIGSHRELKQALEQYWSGTLSLETLLQAGKTLRRDQWLLQKEAGIDLIPCNDFSFYDQVLDMSLTVGAIPKRYEPLQTDPKLTELDLYFAMARGYQRDGFDVIAMEMTKWFDTNYHYLVPEFYPHQTFRLTSHKVIDEFEEAQALSINAKPVMIGPVSFLLLGKEKEPGFSRIELLDNLVPVYIEILHALERRGAGYVQMDEPFLAMDLSAAERQAFASTYIEIARAFPNLKIILTTYFEGLRDNAEFAVHLSVHALHLDLVRAPQQLDAVLAIVPERLHVSLGIVDGRNLWKNDFQASLARISQAVERLGSERVLLAPSCSLLHVPCDLGLETNETALPAEVKRWLAFARQKLDEVVTLARLADTATREPFAKALMDNIADIASRKQSGLIHTPKVKERVAAIAQQDTRRSSPSPLRRKVQREAFKLPPFPTTTIGSFPQTDEVRRLRGQGKRRELSAAQYEAQIQKAIEQAIRWQEGIGLDVLVHGEFERNDMVEYFGEQLAGFAFTQNGWVQSYGSRCVKPPIIYGDIERQGPMTVKWTRYAQSLTDKPVKGMLTGPVTLLQWSFVRDDQPRELTAMQIALAIRDEVSDLETAGICIIQIDEPAIREGLPLRKSDQETYLRWAVKAFRVVSSGVADPTQIHTHMCYSEFNDIIADIAAMDADVITIETSRSQMELLEAFAEFKYPNEIGPGVYDIHSPRVPAVEEMTALLDKALVVVPADNLWVNPDCGLKTRLWPETQAALTNMVAAAKRMRARIASRHTAHHG